MKLRTLTGALALGTALVSLGAGHAQAQTVGAGPADLPTTGTKEIGVAGSLLFTGDNPYLVQANYGVFTTPAIEIGAEGSIAGAKGAGTSSTVGARVDYHFVGTSAALPYIGAFVGYAKPSGDSGTTSLGAQAGVKYFFNPNVAFKAELEYRSARHGDSNTALVFGLSTFFR